MKPETRKKIIIASVFVICLAIFITSIIFLQKTYNNNTSKLSALVAFSQTNVKPTFMLTDANGNISTFDPMTTKLNSDFKINGMMQADGIKSDSTLCIDDVCLTKDELRRLKNIVSDGDNIFKLGQYKLTSSPTDPHLRFNYNNVNEYTMHTSDSPDWGFYSKNLYTLGNSTNYINTSSITNLKNINSNDVNNIKWIDNKSNLLVDSTNINANIANVRNGTLKTYSLCVDRGSFPATRSGDDVYRNGARGYGCAGFYTTGASYDGNYTRDDRKPEYK